MTGWFDRSLVALMIDVDRIKEIDDVFGHGVGDRVLAELAQSCRDHVRPDDIVGRYRGDLARADLAMYEAKRAGGGRMFPGPVYPGLGAAWHGRAGTPS